MKIKLSPQIKFSAGEMGIIMASLRLGGEDASNLADRIDEGMRNASSDVFRAHVSKALKTSKVAEPQF